MIDISHIKSLATTHGFDLCGVTRTTPLPQNSEYLKSWLSDGYGSPLEYMSRYEDVRLDPSKLIDGAKSVIVCAVNYKNEYSIVQTPPRIASYALNRDYHKTIRKRLKAMLRDLQLLYPTLSGRCFTDSAPIFEKQLAINCGLGWIGRQSLVVTPQFGTFILLGEIVIDQEVDIYDTPFNGDRCGSCTRCIEACPVGAINNNRTIDARRCISCRTIEVDNSTYLTLNGWIFGCDECQSCCPHNQKSPLFSNPDFEPITQCSTKEEWEKMDNENFIQKYGSTPLKRSGLERILKAINLIK
ncbi:MAG: tRNA epoxyqueuosine(34) reductase QueG [Rikenellaceae bacterium]